MEDLMKCPQCGARMELGEFKPGDKIARCLYCKTVVDLPDEIPEERITELAEHEKREGVDIQRTFRVVEHGSVSSTDALGQNDQMKEAIRQAEEMMKKLSLEPPVGAASQAKNVKLSNVKVSSNVAVSNTTTAQRVENISFPHGASKVALPAGVDQMLKGMGIDVSGMMGAPESASAPATDEKQASLKSSWWSRHFGKK